MSIPTNAERIEAFIAEHMPEVVLSDWQRDFIRQMFIDGCTCPPISAGTFNDPNRVWRGWNPKCTVHQRKVRSVGEDGPEPYVPKASGGIVKSIPYLTSEWSPPELWTPPRLPGGPVGGPMPYPMDPDEKICFPDGTVKTVREMVGKQPVVDRANRRVNILLAILAGLAVTAVGIVLVLNLRAAL